MTNAIFGKRIQWGTGDEDSIAKPYRLRVIEEELAYCNSLKINIEDKEYVSGGNRRIIESLSLEIAQLELMEILLNSNLYLDALGLEWKYYVDEQRQLIWFESIFVFLPEGKIFLNEDERYELNLAFASNEERLKTLYAKNITSIMYNDFN